MTEVNGHTVRGRLASCAVCRACGRTVDVDCTVGRRPVLRPGNPAGFAIDEAEVVFWGLCPDCQVPARG